MFLCKREYWYVLQSVQSECEVQSVEVKQLLEKGEKMLRDTNDDAISVDLADHMARVRADWQKVNEGMDRRTARMKQANLCAEAFYSHLDKTQVWLRLSQDKLGAKLTVVLERQVVARQLLDVQVHQAELDKKSRDIDELNSYANALIAATDTDHPIVVFKLDTASQLCTALADGTNYPAIIMLH